MHAVQVLSQWLSDRAVIGHRARVTAVLRVVQAVLLGGKLSLTQLGRGRSGGAHVKHHIKAVDRLLGNRHLHGEHERIYRAIAQSLLFATKRPLIVVDWSDFIPGRQWSLLKAAVPLGGRAISVFEQVFPYKRYNSPGAHREFLRALKRVLPDGCRPIIVTDAGFRGPWFREVEAHGWDWIGRIRNNLKYFREQTGRWCFTNSLYAQATTTPRHIGEATLSRRCGYRFRLYLVRAHKPRPGQHPRSSSKALNEHLYRRRHLAPWLLATSLPHERGSARRIKQIYSLRMQIEETFRDLKCHRWGLGLRYARCYSARRLEVLVLLATLAVLVIWLVGLAARALNIARHLQANTETRRPVLSTVFVGRQLLLRRCADFPDDLFRAALLDLQRLVLRALPP